MIRVTTLAIILGVSDWTLKRWDRTGVAKGHKPWATRRVTPDWRGGHYTHDGRKRTVPRDPHYIIADLPKWVHDYIEELEFAMASFKRRKEAGCPSDS